MVCNGYVAGRIAASRGLAIFSNLEMQHSPKIFCIFFQKVLAKTMLQSSNNIELFEFKRTFRKIGRSFLAFQDIPYNSKKNLHSCAGNC
ncbi:hypothetical protein CLOSCI_02473 [[Clostridium] scindens ATCC 35704]|nr:hypothetical protein CLOSCI_02473 [[Clostridium] scindens ATCC 35704]